MNAKTLRAQAAACIVVCTALTGCIVDASAPGPPVVSPSEPSGTLTVQFSVDGSFDPNVCVAYDVDALELVVYDAGGEYAVAYSRCEYFVLSLELPVGTYDADATLVDTEHHAASTTLPLDSLRIVDGTDLAVDVDFPVGSML